MRKNSRMPDDFTDHYVVVVVDPGRKTIEWFDTFDKHASASSYQDGIVDAWEWSRGPSCDFAALDLSNPVEREEWVNMGSPGEELFGHLLKELS